MENILIIDDEKDFCLFIKDALEVTGRYRVIYATSGKGGVRMAKSNKPDLILLDIVMPGIDGLQTLKLLKEDMDTQVIPVIILTAKSDDMYKAEAVSSYCEDYLIKPVGVDILRSKIDNVLKRRQDRADAGKEGVSPDKKPEWEGIKILVIDDEKENCEFIKTFLSVRGFRVSTCSDSEKAMAEFEKVKPQFVILDIVMPKVDGMEILRKIRELDKKIKVFMLTAIKDPQIIRDTVSLGADDIIIKPYSIDQLYATLVKHLSPTYRRRSA